ncbi:hypothetical protein B0H14DRAFT_2603272 [Mycena olivaceomarginata]|nr:hypothetical protein B0H14DRAFT_2603272 [Mycena olivaceomarginata]
MPRMRRSVKIHLRKASIRSSPGHFLVQRDAINLTRQGTWPTLFALPIAPQTTRDTRNDLKPYRACQACAKNPTLPAFETTWSRRVSCTRYGKCGQPRAYHITFTMQATLEHPRKPKSVTRTTLLELLRYIHLDNSPPADARHSSCRCPRATINTSTRRPYISPYVYLDMLGLRITRLNEGGRGRIYARHFSLDDFDTSPVRLKIDWLAVLPAGAHGEHTDPFAILTFRFSCLRRRQALSFCPDRHLSTWSAEDASDANCAGRYDAGDAGARNAAEGSISTGLVHEIWEKAYTDEREGGRNRLATAIGRYEYLYPFLEAAVHDDESFEPMAPSESLLHSSSPSPPSIDSPTVESERGRAKNSTVKSALSRLKPTEWTIPSELVLATPAGQLDTVIGQAEGLHHPILGIRER